MVRPARVQHHLLLLEGEGALGVLAGARVLVGVRLPEPFVSTPPNTRRALLSNLTARHVLLLIYALVRGVLEHRLRGAPVLCRVDVWLVVASSPHKHLLVVLVYTQVVRVGHLRLSLVLHLQLLGQVLLSIPK